MKIRTDFVTNSSSSSFILARKGGLNERQKEAILQYVEKTFLGDVVLSADASEAEIQKFFEDDWMFEENERRQQAVREALASGKDIYEGTVNYECSDIHYADIFERIWEIMDRYDSGSFTAIKDDLSY